MDIFFEEHWQFCLVLHNSHWLVSLALFHLNKYKLFFIIWFLFSHQFVSALIQKLFCIIRKLFKQCCWNTGIKFEFRLKHRGKNIPYHIMTWFYIFSDPMTDERWLGRAINQWHKLILVVFWEILIFHLQINAIFVMVLYSITVMAF